MSGQPRTVLVSISGGRTSGYMAWWMKENQDELSAYLEVPSVKLVFVFANTGMEHDDTLRFLDAIDRNFELGIVWVEGLIHHGIRKSTTHRVTDYKRAFRNSQWEDTAHPFHSYIRKYGIPNIKFRSCTREMKLNAIHSYMGSLGLKRMSSYHTAIGIREDERRRVSKRAGAENIFYPLVDLNPVDKEDVLDWWTQFDWNLRIPEWQGNCVTCYKKSFKKLRQVSAETPDAYEFNAEMERRYSSIGPEFTKYDDAKPRTFFRLNIPTDNLLKMFTDSPEATDYIHLEDGGCSESCELFETEEAS